MNPAELIQGTSEWLSYRAGKVTSSGICDLMATTKDGKTYSQSRAKYMAQLMRDRFALRVDPSYVPPRSYVNAAMQWGTDTEPLARSAYALLFDCDVHQVGFVDHPQVSDSGCSPDGLVGDFGLVEFKCPETHNHIQTLLTEDLDREYIVQMQWQMACTGRLWCDFVSYDPRLEPRFQLFHKRVVRDDLAIRQYEEAVRIFLNALAVTMARLDEKYPLPEDMAA
jgi:hypothetical protein